MTMKKRMTELRWMVEQKSGRCKIRVEQIDLIKNILERERKKL